MANKTIGTGRTDLEFDCLRSKLLKVLKHAYF